LKKNTAVCCNLIHQCWWPFTCRWLWQK